MLTTLKNVKIRKKKSRETTCFEADLYIDGTFAATVENDGWGGDHEFHFDDAVIEQQFYAYCRSLPPVNTEFGLMDMDEEFLIDTLLSEKAMKVE